MVNKKKLALFLGLFGVLLSFTQLDICSISYATEPEYNIYSNGNDTFVGSKTMENIVSELNLFQQYSGDKLESLTYWTNDFLTNFNTYSGDLPIKNIIFATDNVSNDIYLYISNASYPGTNDWPFLYIETNKVYAQMKFTWLKNWVYSGQTISYPITQAYSNLRYTVNSEGWRNGSSISYTVSSFDNSFIYIDNAVALVGVYAIEGYAQNYGYSGYLLSHYANIVTGSTNPSGDDSSGDSIDLTTTNNLLGEINSSIEDQTQAIEDQTQAIEDQTQALTDTPSSGDFTEITSGDILDSLDFEETIDPYENFWSDFTSGLSSALTSDNNTPFDIDVFGTIHTIYPDDWIINYPTPLRVLLTTMCTIGIVILELKMWRRIIILVNTGNLMSLANGFSQNDITDLF